VLLEKPVAGCVEDWQAMVEMAGQSDRPAWVGFQHIHDEGIRRLKSELVSGKWGKIQQMEVQGFWPRGEDYYSRNKWAGKRKVGEVVVNDSPIQNAFAHYLNVALFLAGNEEFTWSTARKVTGELRRIRKELETFDECELCFQLEEDIPFTMNVSHATSWTLDPQLHLTTEKGWVIWQEEFMKGEMEGKTFEVATPVPHATMFKTLLVENGWGCSIQDAGAHVQAVELLTKTLEVTDASESHFDQDLLKASHG
jgi:predicted dehydrogenase